MKRVLLLMIPLLTGCAVAHTARPLGKGNQAVYLSAGGPIAGVGSPDTFVPFLTATYKVGVTDRADVFVGWHILETFVNDGNLFFDVGASYYLLDQKGPLPGVSTAFTISPLITRDAGWASFDLSVTASWAIGRRERHLIYVGMHNFLLPVRGQFVETAQYIWTPYLGGQVRLGKHREVGLGLEIQWQRPYHDTSDSVVSYVSPGNLGAMAFMGGLSFFIGKDQKPADALLEATEPEPTPSEEDPPAGEAVQPTEGAAVQPTEGGTVQAEPDQTEPDQTEPDQGGTVQAEPDQAEPDQAEPDQAEPDQTEPDDEEPADPTASPDADEPTPTDPGGGDATGTPE